MPTILSMKDRIKLTLGKITFVLKPLNTLEQIEVTSHKKMEAGEEIEDLLKSSFSYVKHAVKEVLGVKMHNGEQYKLDFEGEYLTDDCVSEIFTLNLGAEFLHAVQALKYNQTGEKLTYIGTKKPLKGVKLEIIPVGDIKN